MNKKEIKYTIDFYLKDKDYPDAIKRMMKDLFKGKVRTLEDWAKVDSNINGRRC